MRKVFFIVCFLFFIPSLFAQWPFGKDVEWYINGPKKEWNKRDHSKQPRLVVPNFALAREESRAQAAFVGLSSF